jgi:flagellar basal-body rod protein FlgB
VFGQDARAGEFTMIQDDRMRVTMQLLDVAALKAQVHAANIANQNTPGYKAKAVRFDDAFYDAMANGGVDKATKIRAEIFEPRDSAEDNDGNDVSMSREIMDAAKNQTMYNAHIAMARGKMRLLNMAAGQAPGG